ncbi:RING/U-box superfamily protein [Tasmannia lanceolata]|uniref:RING/U-box superfamily protein n=1 Tax=Tasmannia lanceolata TaxID=3420 RepID=UPI004063B357
MEEKWSETLIASLLTLNTRQFSELTHSIFSDSLLHHHRLSLLLLSPGHFSTTLHHLETLSLHHKTILIARLLLNSLQKLTQFWQKHPTHIPSGTPTLRQLDAGLLLLSLCQVSDADHRNLARGSDWHARVTELVLSNLLNSAGFGARGWAVLGPYIDMALQCRRFLDTVTGGSPEVLVGLVEGREGEECVICREELGERREVCELPCEHMFHWECIRPWLKKANTCPCCRLEVPLVDDVFCEIERLWKVVDWKSRWNNSRGDCCG